MAMKVINTSKNMLEINYFENMLMFMPLSVIVMIYIRYRSWLEVKLPLKGL